MLSRMKIIRALILAMALVILIAVPAYAMAYYASLQFSETAGNDYEMMPAWMPFNASVHAANGYMSASGLDTSVRTDGGIVPHMLADDKLLFAYPLSGNTSNPLTFRTGETPISAFDIITGYGGYITVPDASWELADNFTVTLSGWLDTSYTVNSTANKTLAYKPEAYWEGITASENVTAGIYNVDASFTTSDSGATIYGANWEAQTFLSSSNSSLITEVTLKLRRQGSNPGTATAGIRATSSGNVTGGDLTSGTLNGNTVTTGATGDYYTIPLTPFERSSNTTYAVVLRAPSGNATNYITWRMDGTSPAYSDGSRVSSTDSGSIWAIDTTDDLDFYVEGLCPFITATGVSSGECMVSANYTPNLLTNGSFENGDPPTGWTPASSGGAGVSFAQATSPVYLGTYSANLTRTGGVGTAYAYQDLGAGYGGKTITMAARIWCDTADRAVISISDGDGTSWSSYHSGNSSWSWHITTRTIKTGATYATNRIWARNSDGSAFYDTIIEIIGATIPDYNTLRLYIDGVEEAQTYTETPVPDNANDYTFLQGDVMPYADNVSIHTGDTQQLLFEPNAIIIGDTLPDRAGSDDDGTITWGSNPAGVSVVMGSLTASELTTAPTEELEIPGVVGIFNPPSNMFPEESAMTGETMSVLYATISDLAVLTNTDIQYFWWLLCVILVLLSVVWTMRFTQNLMLATLSGGASIGLCIGMSFLPFWVLIVAIVFMITLLVMERSPSV